MFLVLMQHAVIPGWRYLLVFHLPLFFFLSGLVSGNKELPPFGQYVWSRFKRLMIPYFAFGVVDVIIHFILDAAVYHQGYSVLYGLIGIITCQLEPWGGIGVYWFLYTIFVAELLLYPINKFLTGCVSAKWGGEILMLLLSYCSTHWIDLSLFSFDKAFMAAAFILFDNICKPLACRLEELRFKWTQLINSNNWLGRCCYIKDYEPAICADVPKSIRRLFLVHYRCCFWHSCHAGIR